METKNNQPLRCRPRLWRLRHARAMVLAVLEIYGQLTLSQFVRLTYLNRSTLRRALLALHRAGKLRALRSDGRIYYELR